MKSRRLAAIGVGVAAFALIALATASLPEQGETTFSLNVPFAYLDGREGNLADFAGTPLVINFWASWCPACVAEMPDFEQVHSQLGEEVAFLGLAMQETDQAAAENLIAQTGVTYALGEDPDGSIFAQFGGIAMPTTVLIDGQGAVVTTHPGVLFADDLETIIRIELLSS